MKQSLTVIIMGVLSSILISGCATMNEPERLPMTLEQVVGLKRRQGRTDHH